MISAVTRLNIKKVDLIIVIIYVTVKISAYQKEFYWLKRVTELLWLYKSLEYGNVTWGPIIFC